jgi:acetyl-CoA carboxylase carboxyltransferase component
MTRHHARPIRAIHHRSVPLLSVQLRKARGLAAAAMTGIGNARALPLLRVAWPTVEMGPESRYSQGFDDVIDPAETREVIARVLRLTKRAPIGSKGRRRRDSW